MTFYNKFLSTLIKFTIYNISVKDLENFGGENNTKTKIGHFLWVLTYHSGKLYSTIPWTLSEILSS